MSSSSSVVTGRSRSGLALALAIGLVGGSGGVVAAQDDAPSDTISLTDFRGKSIEMPAGADNVVFLVENAMNTFYAVGGADRISGIGTLWQPDYKVDFFGSVDPDFAETPLVSTDEGSVDLEALAATDPDLVVLWSADIDDKDTTAIESSLGVPVYGVFLTSFDDLTKLTQDMAAIVGDPVRGEEVVAQIASTMADITSISSAIPEDERPTVYWMWGDPFRTAGTVSTANDLITAAGGINVIETWDDAAKTDEAVQLPMETIAALDPEVIYLWFNPDIDPQDVIDGAQVAGVDFSTWSGLSAVQNGRVFELDDPFLYDFMTGRQPIATLKIAKDINPEAFADVELDVAYDEFFRSMYGVSYPDYEPVG